MNKCIICGDNTNRPVAAAFEHFHLYAPGNWQYWRGNIKTFGFWSGLSGSISLTFPIYNTLRHWKHLRSRLVLSCTCHPDDRPLGPCPQKYAASECQAAARSSAQKEPQ